MAIDNCTSRHLPYVTCWKTPLCNTQIPGPNCSDPWRTHLCHRLSTSKIDSPSCRNLCPQIQDPCPDIHDALRSLDYFSAPPLFQHGTCSQPMKLRSKSSGGNCRRDRGKSMDCAGLPQLPTGYKPKPKPYTDTICGLCINSDPRECQQNTSCKEVGEPKYGFPAELPFQVYMAECTTDKNSIIPPNAPKQTGQVERCLHPSKFRYLDTSYKMDFSDFFKLKSKCELNLYRSALAIDNARPQLALSMMDEKDSKFIVDPFKPITYNARPIKFKAAAGNNTGPTKFTVSVPGPITIG